MLEFVQEPIKPGLKRITENLENAANQEDPFLAELLNHVLQSKGKRIRPSVALLIALSQKNDEDNVEQMATAVELLHIATLVHDDTVDDSEMRRGKFTVHKLWGQNTAILLGDFIFSSAAALVSQTDNVLVMHRFSQTAIELSRGALNETEEAFKPQTKEQYLNRIYNKTASVFAAIAESAAVLSDLPDEQIKSLRSYGYNLGMAFQIVDDILDFDGNSEELGKPVGADLANGLLTLPAFVVIDQDGDDTVFQSSFTNPHDDDALKTAVSRVQQPDVISEAYAIAQQYSKSAVDALRYLESSRAKESLTVLVEYATTRRN